MELTQEQYDELLKEIRILKFQLQEHQDTLESGITSRNLASFRNTYVINAQDSLDASYPMYVHFNIIEEMVKIVSVKVSFWILNYRAYSTATAGGGGQTTSAGGATTRTTSSGGGQTSSTENKDAVYATYINGIESVTNVGDENKDGYLITNFLDRYVSDYNHTHTVSDHTHTVNIPDHTHTVSDHTHDITYGIHEETNSPTIKFYVSENAGVSYSDVFGGYTKNKSGIDITSQITTAGSKLIKFTSTTRTRLSVQVEIKLDLRAR